MEKLFGKPTPQAQQFVANGPQNPNLNHNPQDSNLTAQQRNVALQNQANQPQGTSNTPAPNPAAMNNQPAGADAQAGAQTSPLDDFAKIWEPPTQDAQQKNQQKKFSYPKFDNTKLQERVGQMNFASAIPDELLSKAIGGDLASMREAMNIVGRQGFQSAFTANNNLNSQLFSQFDASIDERIPAQVKGIQNQAAVFAEMKNLNHPAVAPLLSKVAEQIQMQYPDATPEEIKEKAKIYMGTMAKLITGQIEGEAAANTSQQRSNNGTGQQQNRVTDFSSFDA